jgi:hypothetical protein
MSNPDLGEPSKMSNGESFEPSEQERFDENPEQNSGDLSGRIFDGRNVRELETRRLSGVPCVFDPVRF